MSSTVLPPEVLHMVFEQLTNHSDFHALCQVSRHFYAIAIRFLYRRLKIPSGKGSLTAPLHAVLTPTQQESLLGYGCLHEGELSGCGEFVREFEVGDDGEFVGEFAVGDAANGGISSTNGEIIEAAVENMPRLQSFVWNTSEIQRSRRISASLTEKPRLRSLTLGNLVGDGDAPLLRLHPLHSFTCTLESDFVSFAHRRTPAADYDVVRGILRNSAGTLKALGLHSVLSLRRQYEDEGLLFGTKGDPEAVKLTALKSLSLSNRLFTSKGVKILLHAIDFANLRRLDIIGCRDSDVLLQALSQEPLRLVQLRISATESAIGPFLRSFTGLRELWYEQETAATDWTLPGGRRRIVETNCLTPAVADALGTHGSTLKKLTVKASGNGKPVVLDISTIVQLLQRFQGLTELRCSLTSFPHLTVFSSAPPALHTIQLHLLHSLDHKREIPRLRSLVKSMPGLKVLGIWMGDLSHQFAYSIRRDGVGVTLKSVKCDEWSWMS